MIIIKHYCEDCEGLVMPDREKIEKSTYNLICPDCNKVLEKDIRMEDDDA